MKELPFDAYDFFGYISCGLVVLISAQLILGFPHIFGADLKIFDIVAIVLAVYIAGQMVAGPARFLYEDVLVQKVFCSPTRNLLNQSTSAFRFIFPEFYKPLPIGQRVKVEKKLLDLSINTNDTEGVFMAVRFSKTVLDNERLISRMNTFRDMYGFSRNVSFALGAAGVWFVGAGFSRCDPTLRRYGWISVISATLLFYRFLKFYRQYSFEMFNCFIAE